MGFGSVVVIVNLSAASELYTNEMPLSLSLLQETLVFLAIASFLFEGPRLGRRSTLE